MAKQIYDYWFVQFDFPDENGRPYKTNGGKMVWNDKLKREIPNGFGVKLLKDYILSSNTGDWGKDTISDGLFEVGCVRGADILTLTELPKRYIKSKDKLLSEHDIVIEVSGGSPTQATGRCAYITRGAIERNGGKITCSNFCHAFTLKDYCEASLFYYTWLLLYENDNMFNYEGKTSGLKNFMTEMFLKNCWIDVPHDLASAFFGIVSDYFAQIDTNVAEIISLTKQRDELLPLLMNGQVNSDLIANLNVYCLERIYPNNMKEKIIDNVMAAMQSKLDCQQMKLLKVTLQEQLLNVNVTMMEQPSNNNNLSLLETFISAKRIEGCSERSLRYYQSSIEQFFVLVKLPITQIDTASIRNYLARYQAERKCSKVTIDNMRRILSSFFAWLEDEDYIVKSPVRRIHKVKTDSLVRETLSDEQLEQLRDRCDNSRDLAIIDMLSSTGMRVGELVKLNRQDVNFEERQCVVFGKGNKERIVYFNARTKIHLKAYLAERTDSEKALFVSLKAPHHRLQISGVERRMKKLGQSVQINRVHPHKFRRTLATMAIDKGMPIEQVQRLLGHVRIDTTLHYAMVSQQNVKMSHKKYLG